MRDRISSIVLDAKIEHGIVNKNKYMGLIMEIFLFFCMGHHYIFFFLVFFFFVFPTVKLATKSKSDNNI